MSTQSNKLQENTTENKRFYDIEFNIANNKR